MCLGKGQSVFGEGMVKTQAGFEQAHDAALEGEWVVTESEGLRADKGMARSWLHLSFCN